MIDFAPHLPELLLRWSVRLAVACYLGRVAIDLGRGNLSSPSLSQLARCLWTIGCVCFVTHVICAFAFVHDWSHDRAYEHTAAQTEAVIGVRWGGGLFFNYAFTLLWVADTIAWWSGGLQSPYRIRSYFWTLHAVFAFMMFNATVVFGPPGWRWVALPLGVALTIVYFVSRKRRPIDV